MTPNSLIRTLVLLVFFLVLTGPSLPADDTVGRVLESIQSSVQAGAESVAGDAMREMQSAAIREQSARWGYWGNQPDRYSTWTNHSNRLVPIYTFGLTLGSLRERGSMYANEDLLKERFGLVPSNSFNPNATYHDQTDVPGLLRAAKAAGKRHLILMIFDGMDWQTTRAAAIYKNRGNLYETGRGRGLAFQDYRGTVTDFGWLVTTPWSDGAKPDVDSQTVRRDEQATGGFSAKLAGPMPWHEDGRTMYPIGQDRAMRRTVTDSASSATSLFAGVKTFNGAIGVDANGDPVPSIAHELQNDGFRIGVVTSVPISHATPGSAYSHNVSRKDTQDIARDMLGLPSVMHRSDPLPGLDVLIGAGWGEGSGKDNTQGENFLPGNPHVHQSDIEKAERTKKNPNGRYVVAQRTKGRSGLEVLNESVETARREQLRLFGLFGIKGGHLPFQTADGDYKPTFDVTGAERYTDEDVRENPTLAEMTVAALELLAKPESDEQSELAPFFLALEEGDVDWANHANNLDNSIGAVLSGEKAFEAMVQWIEQNDAWDDTALIVTSDHGHYFSITDPNAIADANRNEP